MTMLLVALVVLVLLYAFLSQGRVAPGQLAQWALVVRIIVVVIVIILQVA